MKTLKYLPKEDITTYELALVLKLLTYFTLPLAMQTEGLLFEVYDSLPAEAQRHFEVIDTDKK